MWTDHKGKLSIRHPDQTGVYSVHKLCLCSRREPFPWNNNASSVCWLMTVASNDSVIGHPVSALTSMGVLSGTSLRITMQRFWLGRTFSPFSSTWTNGKAAGSHKEKVLWAISGRINQYIPPKSPSESASLLRTITFTDLMKPCKMFTFKLWNVSWLCVLKELTGGLKFCVF